MQLHVLYYGHITGTHTLGECILILQSHLSFFENLLMWTFFVVVGLHNFSSQPINLKSVFVIYLHKG